jgi:Zn-dependent metalloprotease
MPHPLPQRIPVPLGVVIGLTIALSCRQAPKAVNVAALTQDAQAPVAVTYNPRTGRPSFIRGRIPVTVMGLVPGDTSRAVSYGFMQRYSTLFGVDSTTQDLRFVDARVDSLGMRHTTMQQVVQGVDVYAATVTVHQAPPEGAIAAATSNVVPDVRVATTQPAITQDSARAIAAKQLPRGVAVSSRLVVYPGQRRASAADLAWIVEVRDDSIPARKDYVIDAGRGKLLDILDRLYTARNRQTYSANNGTSLPGTLRRAETAGPTGDADVDHAHDFVGATYDYYAATHARDSYDNAGATLIATVHYSVNYQNAFWDGTQMVYGDGFPVKDVTAHELTHAVTERTANLEYRWQSGALNESISDIFGAMVDRDDWLMGEDLPIGAIRDLDNPGAFGQPGNASGWVQTCGDNEGVHTNSGIPSKAFVNVATSIGKGDAERIFYRALTVYLQPQSTLEDSRAAALQAAEDLFGVASTQAQAVNTGFGAVGLTGTFSPPANSCGIPGVPDLSLAGFLALALLIVVTAALRARRRRARA